MTGVIDLTDVIIHPRGLTELLLGYLIQARHKPTELPQRERALKALRCEPPVETTGLSAFDLLRWRITGAAILAEIPGASECPAAKQPGTYNGLLVLSERELDEIVLGVNDARSAVEQEYQTLAGAMVRHDTRSAKEIETLRHLRAEHEVLTRLVEDLITLFEVKVPNFERCVPGVHRLTTEEILNVSNDVADLRQGVQRLIGLLDTQWCSLSSKAESIGRSSRESAAALKRIGHEAHDQKQEWEQAAKQVPFLPLRRAQCRRTLELLCIFAETFLGPAIEKGPSSEGAVRVGLNVLRDDCSSAFALLKPFVHDAEPLAERARTALFKK